MSQIKPLTREEIGRLENYSTKGVLGEPPFRRLQEQRAVVDGKHPLDGWRHRAVGTTSVVRKGTTVVVLVPRDGIVSVTSYWDCDEATAAAVLGVVRGWLEFEKLFEQLSGTWSGGPCLMSETEAFYYLATGAGA